MRDSRGTIPAGNAPSSKTLPRYTVVSVLVHVLGTVVLSSLVSPPQKAVFAEPIYSVAFYQAEEAQAAPPEPVRRQVREVTKEAEVKESVPEVKPVETPVKKPDTKPKPKPKPEKKEEPPLKPPLKPPAKREQAVPDRVENDELEVAEVSMGMVDERDFRHNYYLERVRALLAAQWRAPGGKGGLQKATVHFFINRDGGIRGVEVREGSGSTHYDRAALGTVRAVERFPPLPESYSGQSIGISVVFQTVRGGEE